MKKKKGFLSKLIITLVLFGVIVFGYVHSTIYSPINEKNNEDISVLIRSGDSVKEIAVTLKEANVIKSTTAFYGYVRFNNMGSDIVAGRYLLNQTMDVPQVLETITSPSESEFIVTVQEGLTISDIDDKLFALELIEDGNFEKAVKEFNDFENYPFIEQENIAGLELPLEGYLYPDTYYVDSATFESDQLIYKMLDNFKTKFEGVQSIFEAQGRSMHDTITMASILQREVRTPDDYQTVAGILWKRLDSNWHIGADATILYITKKKTISAEDLKLDSPYNTRLHTGMPPGPICNPDIEHIKTVMIPSSTGYWYYLTTLDTGEVIYAVDNDQHNVNKAKYL